MKHGAAVFLDTSIQIARTLHSPATKSRIEARISRFSISVTSEVVKQEFKRRVCSEAVYLLNQIKRHGNLQDVQHHVVNVLGPYHSRKRTICLEMLTTVFARATEPELTERARRYLRTLLRLGLNRFETSVGHVIRDAGCSCARFPIMEKVPYERYDLGPTKCSHVQKSCGLPTFLISRRQPLQAIFEHLKALPESKKSSEIHKAEQFIEAALGDLNASCKYDPCLTIGDLLIAIESADIPCFYTLNGKESQHLCRPLDQDLIVCPVNPDREEVECSASESDWPSF